MATLPVTWRFLARQSYPPASSTRTTRLGHVLAFPLERTGTPWCNGHAPAKALVGEGVAWHPLGCPEYSERARWVNRV